MPCTKSVSAAHCCQTEVTCACWAAGLAPKLHSMLQRFGTACQRALYSTCKVSGVLAVGMMCQVARHCSQLF